MTWNRKVIEGFAFAYQFAQPPSVEENRVSNKYPGAASGHRSGRSC
jgi:hypothetical protein